MSRNRNRGSLRRSTVGVIGPTDVAAIENAVPLARGTLEAAAHRLGTFLADQAFSMACIPDRGVGLWVLESYWHNDGLASLALSPSGAEQLDDSADETPRNSWMATRVRTDLTWENAPAQLVRECDAFACIGLSCGTITEIAWTKWISRFPIFVVKSFVSGIPVEVAAELDLRWCADLADMEAGLLDWKRGWQ